MISFCTSAEHLEDSPKSGKKREETKKKEKKKRKRERERAKNNNNLGTDMKD